MNQFIRSRRSDIGEGLRVSFEFFPPQTETMAAQLWRTVLRLAPLNPEFVSVTYGAGGSTRDRTFKTVERILAETDLDVAAHLTCVGSSRSEVDDVIRQFHKLGVRRFVALRGDNPEGNTSPFRPTDHGYENGADLTAGLKAFADFDITVSAYPEKHPDSPDFQTDIDMLKRKVDNGATRAITQFFYDNDLFEAYVERVRRAGIYIPIVPGILPIHNFHKVRKFAAGCNTHIPQWLADRFEGLEDDVETQRLVSAAVSAEQVMDLIERGVGDFHFYTMNRPELTYAICHMIGVRPVQNGDDLKPLAA